MSGVGEWGRRGGLRRGSECVVLKLNSCHYCTYYNNVLIRKLSLKKKFNICPDSVIRKHGPVVFSFSFSHYTQL